MSEPVVTIDAESDLHDAFGILLLSAAFSRSSRQRRLSPSFGRLPDVSLFAESAQFR
jgi:hypothetical protein